jgi:hypothetical protein
VLGRLLTLLALIVLGASLGAACSSDCETADPTHEVHFQGGRRNAANTYYETADWTERFLRFPPGRRLVIHHELGTPPTIQTYLSFSERGLADGNNASESAGNQLVIETVDARVVKVRNDSCAEFYLRLVATVTGPEPIDASADVAASD